MLEAISHMAYGIKKKYNKLQIGSEKMVACDEGGHI